MRKVCSIAFILALAVSSLIMVQTASASAPIPPVPEFSVKYSIDAYNVEPTYKTDPYTGQTVIEQEGYTGYNKTIFTELKLRSFLQLWIPVATGQNYTTMSDSRGITKMSGSTIQ